MSVFPGYRDETVHPLAKSAFTTVGNSDSWADSRTGLYDRARPSYPDELVDKILEQVPKGQSFNVVELGSGTGIFTRGFLPKATGLASLTAVEPAEGMRASFDSTVTAKASADGPKISCVDGQFDQIPVPDGSADLIIAAQAFHWIGRDKNHANAVMKELARVLKPKTGVVALIWNLEDRDRAKWVGGVRDAYEEYEKDTPQYRHMYWKIIYDTPAYAELFTPKKELSVTRFVPTTRQGVIDRVASKSYISDLDDTTRTKVLSEVGAILDKATDKDWIDESKGEWGYPYRTDVVLIPRK